MKYPFLTYCFDLEVHPIFKALKGEPFVVDLSKDSSLFSRVDIHDQKAFQAWLDQKMEGRFSWGLCAYLEDRRTLLAPYPQMQEQERFFHLGLDIIIDLDTPVHAPLDAVVQAAGYEEGPGNYGGHVLLRHDSDRYETFYSLYGHLKKKSLPDRGTRVNAGQAFARIGDFHENGNWFIHTHVQVITQKGLDQGWFSKGYCTAKDLALMDGLCPSPLPLFKV